MTAVWAWRDWPNLAALRLPDTDDMVRLQQVRDWLAGQRFADLTQYRLGTGGAPVPMHWSRLADLAPGGLIAGVTPLVGQRSAELIAVIAWPGLLFAAALALAGRIARMMHAPASTAVVIAALAFPATAMFLPGRIDHHGLQLVLLLAMVAAVLTPRGFASGIGIALASTASFVIGLETAPFVAMAAALIVVGWVAERPGSSRQLRALAVGFVVALGGAALLFAPTGWTYPACDGFTRDAWLAALIGAAALLGLAALDPLLAGRGPRLLVAVGAGGLALTGVAIVSPGCLHPYGGVDPALAARWLSRVGEAQPLFAAPLATVIGQCGLMLAGLAAGLAALRRTRDPGWVILLLFQGTALAISSWQLRGATAGALLAAPALAWLVDAARTRGTLALAGAWVVSAGILYPFAGQALPAAPAPPDPPACNDPATLAALGRLPPGRVAGPIDLGAWGLAATRHSFLAAPYHRNGAGNRDAFRIFDGPASEAERLLAADDIAYLAICGAPPAWLAQAPRLRQVLRHGDLAVYRTARLPGAAIAP